MPRRYEIQINGLKEGHHTVDFEINNEFFETVEESEIREGSLVANIGMEKSKTHLDLIIRISGTVKIACDRCLELFSQPIQSDNRLLIKFGKEVDDADPDIITVPSDTKDIDLHQQLYEFIILSLPIKRVHPADKNGKSTCDPLMLEKLREHIIEEEKENDPRWDELKRLMNDN